MPSFWLRPAALLALSLACVSCTTSANTTGDAYVPYVPKDCTPTGTPAVCPVGCVELRAPRTSTQTGCCNRDTNTWSTTVTAGVGCYDPFASQNNPGTLCYRDSAANVTYGVTAHIQNLKFYPGFSIDTALPLCM